MTATKSKPKGAAGARKGKKKNRKPTRSAKTSDRLELYELSVQNPEAEIDFVDRVWKERRGRPATLVREDFCGTAISSVEWVRRRPGNVAIGVDIDPAVLDWSRSRMAERLDESQRPRLRLVQADVRTVEVEPVDCVLAMNFSYYLFKTRQEMLKYYRHVHSSLKPGGMFVMDAYGGSDAFVEMEEKRKVDGFTYVWDQHRYNPIDGSSINFIHYRFPDGSEMREAFRYEWRVWTLPEIQELLTEAGFRNVTVYWEGTDEETGEGNDEFDPSTEGEACPGWIAYVVSDK